ncbi:hypothetical protein RFI_27033 [Reticulomyxa filosa]|uniref:Uncharacterized protein n=1 Tax=Reticulomyxa filosa TaxID=46433 RepID=X6MA38_RETFI|nr:hypothetical protein RFI_27033 [Reticulomyxa filosa]|eukprot:ETO10342.1 hypothetical protein RFI_27033 [Reticulomyxa filosa]
MTERLLFFFEKKKTGINPDNVFKMNKYIPLPPFFFGSSNEATSRQKDEANVQMQSSEAGVSNESSETHEQVASGINTAVHPTDPSISFDFLLNISMSTANEAKIKSALAKSVEVEVQQIQDLKITDLGNQSKELVRVAGYVYM